MTNSNHVPKRRFKEFELLNGWVERKLGLIAKYRRGSFPQPYGKKEWYDGPGAMPFVQVVDVSNNLRLVEDTKQKISKIAQDKSVFVPKNTVIVTLQGSIGRVAVTQYDSFVDRTLLIFEDYNLKTDPLFWAYSIQDKFDEESKRAPGGTIKTITKEALSSFDILLPSISEQKSIGKFFQTIDSLIALHQHKLDKLKNLKKSYLAELFPSEGERVPKRRFPGFEGEWKEKKLGEVVEFKRGLTYTPSSISKAGIRVLRSSNIDEDQFVLKEDDVFVDESKISIPFVEKGDILITAANGSSRLVGKHAIIDSTEKMVHGGFMLLAKSNQYKFINALLSSNWYTHFIDRSVLGGNGAIGNLSKSDLENEVPLFPSDEEQKQIGEFFQKIDKSISLQQEKLDKLKDLKKAYLNELFV